MKRVLWNEGWKFSDISGELPAETVDLPHDAMLLERRIPKLIGGAAAGYFPGGCYIYEKDLYLTKEQAEQTIFLEFEGVYQKSRIWLNGEEIGGRIYGYSDILLDLSGKVHAGGNRIRVEADNTQIPNSRWYSGSGIYRDVWLWTGGKEYIRPYGVKLTTKRIDPAVLSVEADACCDPDTFCRISVKKDGAEDVVKEVSQEEKNGSFCVEFTIENALLWTAETPELYDVEVELLRRDTGDVLDRDFEKTGLRVLGWSADRGFQVNGKTVKLRGGCVHHDHGPLGAKCFKDAELRRAGLMKKAGFNAVRYAHNPAGNAFLEACDEIGLYVMDESFDTWFVPKSEYDYGLYFEREHTRDLQDMIRMAYNHPCVAMYSIGNEIALGNTEKTVPLTREMVNLCHTLDSGRPVLNAVNLFLSPSAGKQALQKKQNDPGCPRREGRTKGLTGSLLFNMLSTHFSRIVKMFVSEKSIQKMRNVMEPLDIIGVNYGDSRYETIHKNHPDHLLIGSETYPKEIYSYWEQVKKHSYVGGDFTWTAWDYLGEAGVGAPAYGRGPAFTRPYPCISAGCANIDLTGYLRSQGEYFRVVYGLETKPRLAVHPVSHSGERLSSGSWTFTHALHSWAWQGCEGRMVTVDVYGRGAAVELFLNDVSMGRKPLKKYVVSFCFPYAFGELKAVSYDAEGKPLGEDILYSGEEETLLRLSPEKQEILADRQSLLYVNITFCDKNGIVKSNMDQKIQVFVSGEAELIGLCSANPFTEDTYTGDTCHTYYGRALAVLRSTGETGEIQIEARSRQGLEGCSVIRSVEK